MTCLLATTMLAACSAGSSDGSADSGSAGAAGQSATQACSNSCGTVMASLSSSSSDFSSYIVNIASLTLTGANGAVVQTVPVSTQVDLTQLANLSEIISADQIPAGRYTSVSLTLDYSNATIVVNNGSGTGVTIPASQIIDGSTNVALVAPNPTQMTVTLSLDDNGQLVVTPGTVANLALDFDLDASNTISSTSPTTVTVSPVLTASLVPDTTRQLVLRGPLVSVNASADSYVVGVRPFFNLSNTTGQLTVATTDTTTYTINGTSYTGSAGLTALAALTAGTLTQAYGAWDTSTQTFTASAVLAGSSVAGGGQSSVLGTVLSRSGDTLTVSNSLVFQSGQSGQPGLRFVPQLTATIGSGTSVAEQAQTGTFSIADISVGQQLQLLGSLSISDSSGSSGSSSSSSVSAALDATSGSAELLVTPLVGTVTTSSASQVTVNLQTLAGWPASAFTFAGTGSSSSADATASAYTVAVPSSLSTASLGSGQPVGFTGFVAPFGSAPPDFNALTLTSYAQTPAWFAVRWSPGTASPFATLNSSELLISQTTLQAASQDFLQIASVTLNPASVSSGLELVPNTAATSQTYQAFAIVHSNSFMVNSYSTFNDLVTALTSDLSGTTLATRVSARGPYDASTGVLTADEVIVVLND